MCTIAELRWTTSLRELGPLLDYLLRCLSTRRHSILLGWLLLLLSVHLRIIHNLLSVWPSSHWRRDNSSRWSWIKANVISNWLVRDHFWTRRVWIRLPWRTHRHVHISRILLLMAYHWSRSHTSWKLLRVHLLIRLVLELLLRKIRVHQLLVRSIQLRRVTLIFGLLSIFSVWRLLLKLFGFISCCFWAELVRVWVVHLWSLIGRGMGAPRHVLWLLVIYIIVLIFHIEALLYFKTY